MSSSSEESSYGHGSGGFDQDFLHNTNGRYSNRMNDYVNAWSWLRSLFLDAKYVERSHRFDAANDRGAPTGNVNHALLRAALSMKCYPPFSNDASGDLPSALRNVVEVMDGVYDSEEAFSQRLFHAMVRCFKESGWDVHTILRAPEPLPSTAFEEAYYDEEKERVLDAMVVLGRRDEGAFPSYTLREHVVRIGDHQYAMGLCRTMEDNEYEQSHMKGGKFPDHSWVTFRRAEGDEWQVHRVLASVELTMNNMACPVYKLSRTFSDETDESVDNFSFTYLHRVRGRRRIADLYGPLGEALRDVMDLVRRGRAALGLGTPVGLPIAVVTARRRGAKPHKEPTCWTHGNLRSPIECGGMYGFDVDAFGLFHDRSGQEAATVYLDVLADGLVAAEIWLGSVADRGVRLTASPLTGRTLKFGDQVLEGVHFVASPLTRRSGGSGGSPDEGRLKVSQGELYRGEVNLSRLREATAESERVVWFSDASASLGNTPVLVKVSSDSTYGRLVGRGLLQTHHRSMSSKYMYHSPELLATLMQSLAPSLFGMYVLQHGLVQIMPDLTELGFQPLRPRSFLSDADEAKKMWRAFRQFVDGVLLPLAEIEVLHPDLRPGYDASPNLLYNKDSGEIRMVDLDTLLRLHDWDSLGRDNRIVRLKFLPYYTRRLESATEVLLAQVVVITESWRVKVCDRDAVADDLFLQSEWGQEFLKDASIQCDGVFVRSTLDRIGRRYDP